ncbi:MAG TPA: hypothetical protein VKU02_16490 [Gemmataceae bacterium]|nr:hypothetical protein [Gemmataceae bacterium]
MKRFLCGSVALVLILSGARQARAATISFTFEGKGTGDLSGRSFTETDFTIRGVSDTDAVLFIQRGIFNTPLSTAAIEIAGVGMGTFLTPKSLFINQNTFALGLGEGFPNRLDL